jgi:serine/threonine protein kinase
MKKRKTINHPNLCKVQAFENQKDSSWCSTYYKTRTAIEYHEDNLAEELNTRRRKVRDDPGKYMTEGEVWYILDSVASATKELGKSGLYHGDIQPRNILISKDDEV